jgi:parallel beta-helix repeat protein
MRRFLIFLLPFAALAVSLAASVVSSAQTGAEPPGPSQALFNQPFYTCARNFYVATTGNDSNPGSASQPWQTIQNADTPSRTGGDCINVAPGTYEANVLIQNGGTGPTATGYVVYRCQILDACHILAPGGGRLWGFANAGNFVVVDGFELDGNNSLQTDGIADACIATDDPTYGEGGSPTQAGASAHHIWVLNNIVHHCNEAGVELSGKEWYYTIHNTVYHNSFTSGYQGSGIGYVVVQCIEAGGTHCYTSGISGVPASDYSYVPAGNDLVFNPPAGYAPFHNVVAWNVVYNNRINYNSPNVACNQHTDGNGIIMDTFFDNFSNTLSYPYQTLVMDNISYYNGGRGIHAFDSSNVTVANNTVFNNITDTCLANAASVVGDLSQQGGADNVWINNVSLTVQNYVGNTCSLLAGNGPITTDLNNTYINNVLSINPAAPNAGCLYNNDISYFSCSSNNCGVNPSFVNATAGVAAGSTNEPVGGTWIPGLSNFAITTSSAAYNYGQAEPYLSAQASDAGACYHTLTSCPAIIGGTGEPTYTWNAHDFNGDGKSDIAWLNTSGSAAVWLMNGAQVIQSAVIGSVPTVWSIVGQRDFNGDGTYDWLWRDTSGDLAIWFFSNGQLTQSAGIGNVPTTWSVAGTGDFDGDGMGDILWLNTSGNVAIWFMNGDQVSETAGLGSAPTTWSVAGTGDFNGDGMSDILWFNTSGNIAIWFMNGTQITQSASVGNAPSGWSIVGTGDFNGDGKKDILWRNTNGSVAIWLMNGAQVTASAVVGSVPTTWNIIETGDFNGDGMSDILWSDTSGDVAIWFMNGTQITQSASLGNVPTVWSIKGANAN